MNAIFFGCKRAFHSFMRLTRRAIEALGLTAARFDMLTAVRRGYHGIHQSALRRELGVGRATISRMLCSLEELGLVHREVAPEDRRQRVVTLTAKGLCSIDHATAEFVGSGIIQLAVDSALTQGNPLEWSRAHVAMDEAETVLRNLRDGFGDVARLYYPWHPEET